MSRVGIKKKHSSHFEEKIAIRLEAVKNLDQINVLDCFHASGDIWKRMEQYVSINKFLGIEKNKRLKSTKEVIHDNNLKVLKHINIDNYNVIDLDAYGSPLEQMEIIFKRSEKSKIIIYTFCFYALSGIPLLMSEAPRIQERCKTIMNQYFEEMFSSYLKKHGITEWYDITFTGNIKKMYGYFYYNPEKDLTRTE